MSSYATLIGYADGVEVLSAFDPAALPNGLAAFNSSHTNDRMDGFSAGIVGGSSSGDNFNRANEQLSASANWDEQTGDTRVVSNELKTFQQSAYNLGIWQPTIAEGTQFAELTVTGWADSLSGVFAVLRKAPNTNWDATADQYYAFSYSRQSADHAWILNRKSAGSGGARFVTVPAADPGQVYTLKLVVRVGDYKPWNIGAIAI